MLLLLVLLLFLNQDDAAADADADAEMIVLRLLLERKPHGQHYYRCLLISARRLPLRLAKKL